MVRPITAGRTGNFLFQAAMAIGYALRHGLEYTMPDSTNNAYVNPIHFSHLIHPKWNPDLPSILVEEKAFCYQTIPFSEEWREKNIMFRGWWQTERYFKNFRPEIISAFGLPWHKDEGTVAVHVRRGDYLRLTTKHPPVPKEWIEKAMSLFPGHVFQFHSDDIPWCKEQFGGRERVVFSEGKKELEDIVSISCCEHQICSASTFSWWGAWLNQNPKKRVILPKLWYMPGHGGFDLKDIVPKEWTRL